uniref:Conserved uncharacterized protein n=1 Tax=Clytia hemisphaerica TaxID=252671 RepID=A0A069DLV9_9CNID
MSNIYLKIITDIDQYQEIEGGIRDGVSNITTRHASSNNPNEPDFDPTRPDEHLVYWDANNLYGYAMSQYLPTGGFTWLTAGEIKSLM